MEPSPQLYAGPDALQSLAGTSRSLKVRFDPGDHLHLNTAGYEALANAIDLKLFR